MSERAPESTLPADVYPDSRNRLPLVKRDELDEDGKQIYDGYLNNPLSLAGLQGPGGIRLHSPRLAARTRPVNRYLRYEAGLDRRLSELAMLIAAREMNQHFEWYQHEPVALKEGVEPEIIDVVRHRKPTTGLGEKEAVLIQLGREAIGRHAVAPETFATAYRLFGAEMLVNYVSLLAEYAASAIMLTIFDQRLPPGTTSTLPTG